MSTGLWSGNVGLWGGFTGLSGGGGLWGGGGGRFPPDGTPSLSIDFVGGFSSLDLSFTRQSYSAFQADASQPQSGFIDLQVWN